MTIQTPTPRHRLGRATAQPRVMIAGAGIGGLEAALAVRALAGPDVRIEITAPDDTFVYRPLTVLQPFGRALTPRLALASLRPSHAIDHRRDVVERVDAARREVALRDGDTVPYDALVVATGARPEAWLQGSLCFVGERGVAGMRTLLERLAAGELRHVCFAAPPTAWTLPAHELALLTADWCAERDLRDIELSVVTGEPRPAAVFGAAAAGTVGRLLGDRGIALVTNDAATAVQDGSLRLASGATVRADAVVSLPVLRHSPLAGLPADQQGFIPVDERAAVRGVAHVYAVGDATDQPIKQGGLAAQQAEVAATAIARALGAPVPPARFRPQLEGLLLGGVGAAALQAWPAQVLAGRHLGPHLAAHGGGPVQPTSTDGDGLRRIAFELAQAEADRGDVHTALRWLRSRDALAGPGEAGRRTMSDQA